MPSLYPVLSKVRRNQHPADEIQIAESRSFSTSSFDIYLFTVITIRYYHPYAFPNSDQLATRNKILLN